MSEESTPATPEETPAAETQTPEAATSKATTSQAAAPEAATSEAASPGTLCEDSIREELKKVIDPELFVNIIDLGLVYVVDMQPQEDGQTNVMIDMTLTSPACPAGPQLIGQSKMVVAQMEGVGEVEVKIVMDPPWSPDRMTEDARDQLGIF